MFGNFLEETATGTGATLALAGATTGNIHFQEKFADGDLVAYVVDDSGGTIKVGGVGTYVSATDDITRNYTWNWNGTTYDDNPSTNITLSGGTHTVRCDTTSATLSPVEFPRDIISGQSLICGSGTQYASTYSGMNTGIIYYVPFTNEYNRAFATIGTEILTAVASGEVRLAIYKQNEDGSVGGLIAETGVLDASTTGFKEESQAIFLEAGSYFSATLINDTIISTACCDTRGTSFERIATASNDSATGVAHYSASQTYGAFPNPSPAITTATVTTRQMLVYLEV